MTDSTPDVDSLESELLGALGDGASALQRRQCRRAAELSVLAGRARSQALSGAAFDPTEIRRIEEMSEAAIVALALPAAPAVSKLEIELVSPRALRALSDSELDALKSIVSKVHAAAADAGEAVPELSPAMKEAHAAVQEIAEHYRRAMDENAHLRTQNDAMHAKISELARENDRAWLAGRAAAGAGGDGAAAALPAPEATPAVPSPAMASIGGAKTEPPNASNVVPIDAEERARLIAERRRLAGDNIMQASRQPMDDGGGLGPLSPHGAGRFDNRII